jgi:hypothetical protein
MTARVLVEADLRNIREMLGVSGVEFSYLMGSNLIGYTLSRERGGLRPVQDPRVAILMAIFESYPDGRYFPMPEMPSYEDVFEAVKDNWVTENNKFNLPYKNISAGTFGPMLGVNFSAGYGWSRGGRYDNIIARLLWVLNNMINLEGVAGLNKFLEVVDKEARSRGLDGVAAVFKRRGWTDGKPGAGATDAKLKPKKKPSIKKKVKE